MLTKFSSVVVILILFQVRAEDSLQDYQAQCGKQQELKEGDKVVVQSFRFGKHGNYGTNSVCDWSFTGSQSCPVIQIQCPVLDLRPKNGWDHIEVTNQKGKFLFACSDNVFFIPYKSMGDLKFKFLQENPSYKTFGKKYKGFQCFVTCANDVNAKWLPKGVKPKGYVPNAVSRDDPEVKCTCSQPDPENPADKFPWVVAIVEEGTRIPWCSGTILNSKFILTSVSCMTCHANRAKKEVMFEVIVGAQRMQKWSYEKEMNKRQRFEDRDGKYRYPQDRMNVGDVDAEEKSTRHKIAQKITSPAFGTAKVYDFDIMLLELSPPLDAHQLNRRGSVCLPAPVELWKLHRAGYAVGWGSAVGGDKYENKSVTEHQMPHESKIESEKCVHEIKCVPEPTLCVIRWKEYHNAIDHGGPFIYEQKDPLYFEQLGILSEKYGEKLYFTNVMEHLDWIKKNADVDGARACRPPAGV